MKKINFSSKIIGIMFLAVIVFGVFADNASAQYRPTLSPWLSMFERNPGSVLDPYHENVLPRQRAIEEFNRQDKLIQRQDAQQRNLSKDLDDFLHQPNKIGSLSGQQGAGYRQYLHYYKTMPQGGVPNYSQPVQGRRW